MMKLYKFYLVLTQFWSR